MRVATTIPLVLKLAGDPAEFGEFSGVAATWETDRHGERFAPGAFRKSLAAWSARGALPPLLWAHDPTEPIGALTAATETADGLQVVARIALATVNGRRAYELLKTAPGALAMSVGFDPIEIDTTGRVPTYRQVDLAEVSLVAIPAQPGAVVREVKAAERWTSRREFEHAARNALGLSANEAKRLAAGGWAALARHEPDSGPDERADALAAALTRIANTRI